MAKTSKQAVTADNKSIVGLFVAAIAVLAIGLVASKTIFDQLQFRNRVISERREVQQVIDSNLELADELSNNYNLLKLDGLGSDALFQIMAPNYDFTSFASIVNEIANSSAIDELTEITPIDEIESDSSLNEGDSTPISFQVSLNVNGNYGSIRQFIQNMQSAAQPIEINQVEISGEGNSLSADILITSYYQQKVGINAGEEVVR